MRPGNSFVLVAMRRRRRLVASEWLTLLMAAVTIMQVVLAKQMAWPIRPRHLQSTGGDITSAPSARSLKQRPTTAPTRLSLKRRPIASVKGPTVTPTLLSQKGSRPSVNPVNTPSCSPGGELTFPPWGPGNGKGEYGKGSTSKKKGKKDKKGKKEKMGKKSSKKGGGAFCDSYNFYPSDTGKGKGGKGGMMGRHQRRIQHGCSSNVFATTSANSAYTLFFELLQSTDAIMILGCPGPFTILAPSNAALERNPSLLQYLQDPENYDDAYELLANHIVPGIRVSTSFLPGRLATVQGGSIQISENPLRFNGADVVEGDVMSCNGLVHVLNGVLLQPDNGILPPQCTYLDFQSNGGFQNGGALCTPNIFDTAQQQCDETSTFQNLLKAAGLTDLFLCAGPFTALIPSNEAFNKLAPSLLASLLKPSNQNQLRDVLLYHILVGRILTTTVQPGPVQTLYGASVYISVNPILFNSAGIVTGDTPACNGVIQIIDTVLIPPAKPDPPEICTSSPASSPPANRPTIAPSTLSLKNRPTISPTTLSFKNRPAAPNSPIVQPPPPPPPVAPPATNLPGSTESPTSSGGGQDNIPTIMPGSGTTPSAPISAPSSEALSSSPTTTYIEVTVLDYYIAYVVPTLTAVPSNSVIMQLMNVSTAFYDKLFRAYYADNPNVKYNSVKFTFDETKYGIGLPEQRFNLYVHFTTDVFFDRSSIGPIPNPLDAFNVMMANSTLYEDYILNYVRTIPELYQTIEVSFNAQAFDSRVPRAYSWEAPTAAPADSAVKKTSLLVSGVASGVGVFLLALCCIYMIEHRRGTFMIHPEHESLGGKAVPVSSVGSSTQSTTGGSTDMVSDHHDCLATSRVSLVSHTPSS